MSRERVSALYYFFLHNNSLPSSPAMSCKSIGTNSCDDEIWLNYYRNIVTGIWYSNKLLPITFNHSHMFIHRLYITMEHNYSASHLILINNIILKYIICDGHEREKNDSHELLIKCKKKKKFINVVEGSWYFEIHSSVDFMPFSKLANLISY